jgi:hypothetical protein
MSTPITLDDPTAASDRRASLAKKLGAGAFLFFLIKGLAWLLVPLAATLLW